MNHVMLLKGKRGRDGGTKCVRRHFVEVSLLFDNIYIIHKSDSFYFVLYLEHNTNEFRVFAMQSERSFI